MNPSPDPKTQSTWGHLTGLFAGGAQYLKARLSLLVIEAKSAGIQYGVGLALGAGGVFVAVLGYVFLVITAVFGIAAAWSWQHAWIVVLGAAALLHLIGALALLLLALRKFKAGTFEATIEELKKDRECLTQPTKPINKS